MQVIIFSQNPGRPRIRDISYGLPVVRCTHWTCTWSILAPFPDAVVCSFSSLAVDREWERWKLSLPSGSPIDIAAADYTANSSPLLFFSSLGLEELRCSEDLRIERERTREKDSREWMLAYLFARSVSLAFLLLPECLNPLKFLKNPNNIMFQTVAEVHLLWSIWYIVLRRLINNWNLR